MVQLKHFSSLLLPPIICRSCDFDKHTHNNFQKIVVEIIRLIMVKINEFILQHIQILIRHYLKKLQNKNHHCWSSLLFRFYYPFIDGSTYSEQSSSLNKILIPITNDLNMLKS